MMFLYLQKLYYHCILNMYHGSHVNTTDCKLIRVPNISNYHGITNFL